MLTAAEPEEEVEESHGGAESEKERGAGASERAPQAKPQVARRPMPSHLAESHSSEAHNVIWLPALLARMV